MKFHWRGRHGTKRTEPSLKGNPARDIRRAAKCAVEALEQRLLFTALNTPTLALSSITSSSAYMTWTDTPDTRT